MHKLDPTKFTIEIDRLPNVQELKALFLQTTWAKDRNEKGIGVLIENLTVYVSIRDGNELIGFGRATTDRIYRALIDDVIVDEHYRKAGIGKMIMSSLLEQLNTVEEIFLNTREGLKTYYEQFGFEKDKIVNMVKRQEQKEA